MILVPFEPSLQAKLERSPSSGFGIGDRSKTSFLGISERQHRDVPPPGAYEVEDLVSFFPCALPFRCTAPPCSSLWASVTRSLTSPLVVSNADVFTGQVVVIVPFSHPGEQQLGREIQISSSRG